MGSTEDEAAHVGSTLWPRRHRNRGSGGFLLDPLAKTNLLRTISVGSRRDRKGKQRNENDEPFTPERGSGITAGQHGRMNGSPLSKEYVSESENGVSPSAASPSISGSTASVQPNGRPSSRSTSNASNVGFDSDPARIVDMALRLSEGRKLQAMRSVSTGVSGLNVVNIRSPSTSARSPTPYNVGQNTLAANHDSDLSNSQNSYAETSPSLPTVVESAFEITKATLIRAEKAKAYIELGYQHRRLLPHLPPIRQPVMHSDGSSLARNKVYNPLQYARNRKLRLREKAGLAPEIDGWHDISKVKAWVDSAIDSHTETEHDPIECVRLPPFSQRDEGQDGDKSLPESPQNKHGNRARRPKSDWVTHPADLLADAYWLEQGLNKTKIQDRHNRVIYPPDTQFKYAGWGQRAAFSRVPESLQQASSPKDTKDTPKQHSPLPSAPMLPTFQSTRQQGSNPQFLNGPRRLKRSLVNDAKDTTRKALEIFEKSSDSSSESSSTTSESEIVQQPRGRRKKSKPFQFDLPDGDPFTTQMTVSDNTSEPKNRISMDNDSERQSGERERVFRKSASKLQPGSSNSKERRERQRLPFYRRSRSRSSDDGDTTSPASPIHYDVPSIAIDPSPTQSRSSSPIKRAGVFKSLRGKHDHLNDQVDTTDFAQQPRLSHSRDPSTDADRSWNGSGNDSRGTSPFDKARRRSTSHEGQKTRLLPDRGSVSRTSTKSTPINTDHQSRIRGMFKGGRIAEIVGNEVSKVGDYIWKREPPGERYQRSVSDQNSIHQTSESEGEVGRDESSYTTPPRNTRGSISSTSSYMGPRKSIEGAAQRNSYHNPNLPSFVSPFQRDREKQDKERDDNASKQGDQDHISVQAERHRSRSRSARLDRLAPPKLDTSGSPVDRRGSNGPGEALDLSKSRSASQIYNEAIGHGPNQGSFTSNINQLKNGKLSDGSIPREPVTVSKRDLLRIETLLLISAIKANGIMCAQTQQSLNDNGSTSMVHKHQYDEHVQSAHAVISRIEAHNDRFKGGLTTFTKTTVGNLHSELQRLEDHIENTLTPRVRATADNAGELSMKLTTSSKLAGKAVNDIISEAFRFRKRGPFRWLRSLGYAAIEWGVVGLLWLIWAVVTTIRIFLATFGFGIRVVRWLLWID